MLGEIGLAGREVPANPAAKKRFRIEKLEERITPKKGGGGYLSSGLTYSASVGGGIY